MSQKSVVVINTPQGSVHIPKHSKVIENLNFLRKLHHVAKEIEQGKRSPQDLKLLLQRASSSEIKALSEISQNLLQKSFPTLTKRLIRTLFPFKTLIRRLASSKTNITQKRKLLLRRKPQKGGFAFLIPLLAPIVGTLISAGIQAAL